MSNNELTQESDRESGEESVDEISLAETITRIYSEFDQGTSKVMLNSDLSAFMPAS